mmetsp:Transcript_46862/g.63578  ORF Transcript_46862/g.63578 Transcript_46862/m.63578 type:complete len:216 (-) Transcript_46862:406-1053(-)|eukprot:CAMPEP_0176341242 /NCGR_PEP_ID=MMETSP0126-20121128/2215_1 /TAXON_ID=141414 ORGANISM="Strombidinopsis acuminatum, Strain SPMC142" /NCGR_SAMPLE_ID=MMETSP0126 /ASSEMBLY_ACC=CAM_ASM_000229 /LENGTH=215 /DNA_ID=CAMNT_0017685929 /DNA_START=163 /DNA_END=810 /DNA_ORIENTATION=+
MYDDTTKKIKLVDFGLATQSAQKVQDVCGSGYYMSPGVLTRSYGKACDLWSLGVTLYYLIECKFPFEGKTMSQLVSKIKRGVFAPPKHGSEDCRDLIVKLLELDPKKRITAKEAVKHKWIVNTLNNRRESDASAMRLISLNRSGLMESSTLKRLKTFSNTTLLRKAILYAYINFLDEEKTHELKVAFEQIDTDRSGYISIQELKNSVSDSELEAS